MELEIIKHKPDYSDERGYIHNTFKGEDAKQVTVLFRKAGTISGNHYHKGEDPSKNPEKFLIIKGKMKFRAESLEGELLREEIVDDLTEIRIPPFVKHTFEALEDTWFIEYRKTPFDKNNPDTYRD
ncbi:MAG: hypothetical protein J7L45_00790 [Candidatus Aenigmarchaeota archaeon]|nr:hypothetical protein [Candidatus Aenigmarchaeota archaeon]